MNANDKMHSEKAIDIFLRYMEAEEALVVFGIPGGLLHPFFEAVNLDPRFKLIVTKHEEGAAFMADGYVRTSHKSAYRSFMCLCSFVTFAFSLLS